MIIQIMAIIMMEIDWCSFFEQNKDSLIAGVLSGALLGFCSWIFHLLKETPPILQISKKICHYSGDDNLYRIKVLNKSFSNLKITSANFVVSYTPNGKKGLTKNDIVIATKKDDPLLFGLREKRRRKAIKTFDTFVIDAQKCIEKETIAKKTSENIQDIFQKGELTLIDFFKEDNAAILSAVFYVQNHRTGVTRNYCQIFSYDDIKQGRFKSGRSLEIEPYSDDPKGSDA